MSIELMTAVWKLQLGSLSEKMVLLALADAANDDGVTWMAVRSRKAGKMDLIRKCSISERSVQGAIARLVQQGYLVRHENPGRGVVYVVSATPAKTAGVQLPLLNLTPAEFAGPPAGSAGKPSINPKIEKEGRGADAPVDNCSLSGRVLPSRLEAWQWAAYIEMRRAIGKPLGAPAATILLSRLDAIGANGWHIGDVVEKAIVNGWTDFHEPPAGRVSGVRRIVAGNPVKPVGATAEDLARIAEIDALENLNARLEARADFYRKAERRNSASSMEEILATLPFNITGGRK